MTSEERIAKPLYSQRLCRGSNLLFGHVVQVFTRELVIVAIPTRTPGVRTPTELRNAPGCVPEIFCLWASQLHFFERHVIKHLAEQIRRGNWASRGMPAAH